MRYTIKIYRNFNAWIYSMNYTDKIYSLTPEQYRIVIEKGTEQPYTGGYELAQSQGSYLCKRCGLALFRASHQFNSACGWPAFDDQIEGAVAQTLDADGTRTEITCSRCNAHLGHVFSGEQHTPKNIRHCVNAASMDFVNSENIHDSDEIIVAGGCFWGIEFLMQQLPGVVLAESGYTGGQKDSPSYQEVCSGTTEHYESVRILWDSAKIEVEAVLRHFFEIHNPEQSGGQGADIGSQYQSAVFVYNTHQKKVAELLLGHLSANGYKPVTRILPILRFWRAEEYHQDYYEKHNLQARCHRPQKRFK